MQILMTVLSPRMTVRSLRKT